MAQGISIVLPAYNEEESLPVTVRRALEVMPELAPEFEIVIVDDGSTDRTHEVACAWRRTPRIVDTERRCGPGSRWRDPSSSSTPTRTISSTSAICAISFRW